MNSVALGGLLALLLVAPSAVGAESILVPDNAYEETPIGRVSSDYSFTFSADHFSGNETGNGSIDNLGVELAMDYGTVGGSEVPAAFTTYLISNATKTVSVGVHTYAERRLGIWTSHTNIFRDGELLWHDSSVDLLYTFRSLPYKASAIVGFGHDIRAVNESHGANLVDISLVTTQQYAGGDVFGVDPNEGARFFGGGTAVFGQTHRLHVANLSGVTSVVVQTDFLSGSPESATLKRMFETQGDVVARLAGDGPCVHFGGNPLAALAGLLIETTHAIIGVCPTVTGFAGLVVGFFAKGLEFILSPIPGAVPLVQGLGALTEAVLDAYLFSLLIPLLSPGKFMVILLAHIVGYSFLIAAYTRDPRDVVSGIKGGVVGTGRFLWAYALFAVRAAMWSFTFFAGILRAVIGAIRGGG